MKPMKMAKFFKKKFFQPATLLRYSTEEIEEGEAIPGEPVRISISAMPLQPISGKDLQLFPEGEVVEDIEKTYTDADVRIREDSVKSDELIMPNGKTYQVIKVHDRTDVSDFKKVFVRKVI